jgi:ATP-binding protein involved in chromosome partitioning
MAEVTEQEILKALTRVVDAERDEDIVTLGMVKGIQIKGGHVAFAIEVDAARGAKMEPLRKQAEKVVHGLPGVMSATVVLTAERATGQGRGGNGGQQAAQGHGHAHGHAHDHGHGHGHAHGHGQAQPAMLPGVRSIVAVASGKGGVGKSTVAVNLALAFAAIGRKVGILDSDIYGPSMPRMMGIVGQPSSRDGKTLDAMENFGVKCMSIGFMVDEESPIIWRGPMVQSAIEQMMRDVNWGELDVLVVDMPPGTGDAQLTMAQKVPLTGAVIVSTPQDIALLDARKGLNMFRKVDVPVLGIVENMSYFACPKCGHRTEIFSHGGAHKEADRLGVDFLGEIPLDIVIRETSDGGQPIVVAKPDSAHAKAFVAIATKVWGKIERLTGAGAETGGPRIVVQ